MVLSKQMSVRVLSTITMSVSNISPPNCSRQNTAQRCSSEREKEKQNINLIEQTDMCLRNKQSIYTNALSRGQSSLNVCKYWALCVLVGNKLQWAKGMHDNRPQRVIMDRARAKNIRWHNTRKTFWHAVPIRCQYNSSTTCIKTKRKVIKQGVGKRRDFYVQQASY